MMLGKKLLSAFLSFITCVSVFAVGDKTITGGKWEIVLKENTKTAEFNYNGKTILSDVYAEAKIPGATLKSFDYRKTEVTQESIADNFGKGEKYTVRYSGLNGKPDLLQVFYFYSDKNYFLTEALISSKKNESSNYIAPIITTAKNAFLPEDVNNRVLSVPFDNDNFVRYSSFPLTKDSVSFEATAIFNGMTREGLVIGSVEHDTWKTGIRYSTRDNRFVEKLECFGGITHKETRDINSGKGKNPVTSKEHGSINGKLLKSPKLFVGFFGDWRKGLDEFGAANALVTPPRHWTKGTPFGWNSWGAMETKVNYLGVTDISDFIKTELQPRSFENNGQTYIGLDSWWNENFSDDDLIAFVKHCNANGQEAGIYWCPFSHWSTNGNDRMDGTDGKYKYQDAYLFADGQVRSVESRVLDPTHPGTKMMMKYQIERFRKWGFKYIKLDFINSGIVEADSFYDKKITTGVQAYNYGMQYLVDLCGEDMFLALSIAPTFPSQYGHSKRISCDAWGDINQTAYMLNSLSFGWWLDKVYAFNDADHLILYDEASNKRFSEGENRARITSGVITGLYMLGDNYSKKGSYPGTETARERALKFATNAEINEIARSGRSFYPVDGYSAPTPDGTENFFMMDTDKYVYLAVFNFQDNTSLSGYMDFPRLGLSAESGITIKELWTGASVNTIGGKLPYSVPGKDARVYRITKAH